MLSVGQVADRLRCRWGASEVYLFGSVARRASGHGRVRPDSDIDIAVCGVDPTSYFAVLADIDAIPPLPVDLVLMEDCSTGLLEAIRRDSVRV